MADVIYSVAVSLDSFVARPDLDLDWLGPFMASGENYTGPFIDSAEALIVGSRTYAESEQSINQVNADETQAYNDAVAAADAGSCTAPTPQTTQTTIS